MEPPDRRRRVVLTAVSLLALALALRLPWLGDIPNPNGDEGNWAIFGLRALRTHRVALPPDASFVTTLFAWIIAAAYRVLGVSFAAARAVPTFAVSLAAPVTFLLARRLGLARAGFVAGLALALHPWSVAWSRTVSVPYALCLALNVVGPLALLYTLRHRTIPALLATSLLLGLGAHFSPLALLPAVAAAGVWLTARPRRSGRDTALLALPAAALVTPPFFGALGVRSATNHHAAAEYFTAFPERLHTFVRATLGGASGESTLRHFTAVRTPSPIEALVALGVVALLALALTAPADDSPRGALSRWLRWHLPVALVGTPLLLAPARTWNLPAVDADRYLFTLVAPLALALGLLAESPSRGRRLAVVAALSLLSAQTLRWANDLLRGGGRDRGAWLLADGGAYRGWRTPRERVALPVLIRREVDRLRGRERALVVVSDYAFHPQHFADAAGGARVVDVAKFPLPERAGWLHVFVRWSPGLFVEGYAPREWVDRDRALGALMRRDDFTGLHRERVFVQPDGSPLCELWVARRRAVAGR